MQRLLVCLACVFALSVLGWGSANSYALPITDLSIAQSFDNRDINLEYLIAPDSETFSAVAGAAYADAWQSNEKPTLNIGYQPAGAWVRFHLVNPRPDAVRRLLLIDWSFERVEARVLGHASGGWSEVVSTGSTVTPSERALKSPVLVLPLTLPPGAAEVYLRLQATQPMVLPIRLIDLAAFNLEERNENLRMGAFFGAMLVMMLYNASLFIFTRDRSYISYCWYLASAAFYVASEYGYGPYFLWSDWQWFAQRSNFLSVSLAFLAAGLFERQFLNLKGEGGWVLRLSNLVIAYWSVAALVSVVNPWAMGYLYIEHGGFITCVLALSIAFLVWLRGNASAGFFLVAWSGLVATTLCLTLAMAGLIPMSSYVRSAQLMGFVLEFLLLSIALADRINREKASRLRAQKALLVAQEQANALLEDRVASRTHQLEQANQELRRLSSTDPLTGVSNRRGFEERVSASIERGRAEGQCLAFLMLDIDHFKRINDQYGHGVGDECLAVLGATLATFSRRDNEFAARLGGEEFAVIFYGMSALSAEAIAEKIRVAVAELELELPASSIRFSVSIGVAAWIPTTGDSPLTYAKAADEALYRAKAQGRNQVCLALSEYA